MPKILIVDDHPLYREGVIGALTRRLPGVAVLGAATAQAGLLVMDADPELDLVLIDWCLPDLVGLDALALYGRQHAGVARVLISGQNLTEGTLEQAMRAGASGFIPKSISVGRMVDAILIVLDGGIFLPRLGGSESDEPDVATPCVDAPGGAGSACDDVAQSMSVRQLEVLTLLAEGRSNKDIARRLDIAERTVKAHATGLFQLLGATNRTQAVVAAHRLGLLAG